MDHTSNGTIFVIRILALPAPLLLLYERDHVGGVGSTLKYVDRWKNICFLRGGSGSGLLSTESLWSHWQYFPLRGSVTFVRVASWYVRVASYNVRVASWYINSYQHINSHIFTRNSHMYINSQLAHCNLHNRNPQRGGRGAVNKNHMKQRPFKWHQFHML